VHKRAGHALASGRLLLGDDDDIYGDTKRRESVAQSHHLVELAVHLRLDHEEVEVAVLASAATRPRAEERLCDR
jgi:hypothetical protein